MNKPKLLLLFLLSTLSFYLSAQSLSPTVIASGGTYATSGVGSLSYTVGEMSAVSTLSTTGSILTQGFQQADIDQGSAILSLEPNDPGAMIIYPNPADKTFTVGYKFPNSGSVKAILYDANGKIVSSILEEKYVNGDAVYNYDCSQVAAGNYVVGLEYTSGDGASTYTLQKQLIIIKQ